MADRHVINLNPRSPRLATARAISYLAHAEYNAFLLKARRTHQHVTYSDYMTLVLSGDEEALYWYGHAIESYQGKEAPVTRS